MLSQVKSIEQVQTIYLDRKAAIKFFSSVAGRRFIGGASGSHPDANMKGDQDARLRAILRTLERNRYDIFALF